MRYDQPPAQARNHGRPPDDLDGLLRTFMRAEMPDPWPTMKFPAPAKTLPLTPSKRWPLLNSRFALAATVAFCLVGSMSLASIFSTELPTKGSAETTAGNAGPEVTWRKLPNGDMVIVTTEKNGDKTTVSVRREKPAVELEPMAPQDE